MVNDADKADERFWWGILAAVVGTALAALFFVTPLRAWDLGELNRTVDSANFRVNSGCSGTLIDPGKGLILSAHHCIDDHIDMVEREITGRGGITFTGKVKVIRDVEVEQMTFDEGEHVMTAAYRARVLAAEKSVDLALLQVVAKLPNTVAAKVGCTNPQRGEPIYTVGNPTGELYSSVTAGIVSSLQRSYETIGPIEGDKHGSNGPLMQVSGGLVGGHSGGAVYNGKGELIGVPVLVNDHETLGFAVPLPVIKEFLKAAGVDEALWACKPQPKDGE